MDNELILYDRIEIIKQVINKYGEDNFHISFSGGKDSTVLHYLIDEALPNNKIERVFINTGLEFVDIVKFVKNFCQNDDRFVIINNERNIKLSLEEYGYPFKSKMHSKKVSEYQRNGLTMSPRNYLNGTKSDGTGSLFKCPNCLKYQFTCENDLKISEKCCELSDNEKTLFFEKDGHLCVKEATKIGYKIVENFDTINVEYPKSKTRRGRVGKKVCPTLTTHPRIAIYYNGKLRMLTALEHWRLMGFKDESFYRIKKSGLTEKQISFLAGNSICVQVLESLFLALEDQGFISR